MSAKIHNKLNNSITSNQVERLFECCEYTKYGVTYALTHKHDENIIYHLDKTPGKLIKHFQIELNKHVIEFKHFLSVYRLDHTFSRWKFIMKHHDKIEWKHLSDSDIALLLIAYNWLQNYNQYDNDYIENEQLSAAKIYPYNTDFDINGKIPIVCPLTSFFSIIFFISL